MSFRNWTMAEVAAHNERVAGPLRSELEYRKPDGTTTLIREHQLHSDILDECNRRGWICLHGSMAHRTRRTPGEFDFVILADGGRVLLIEAKSRTGKLSKDQAALHAWARKLGHQCWVVRSMEEFQKAVTMEPI